MKSIDKYIRYSTYTHVKQRLIQRFKTDITRSEYRVLCEQASSKDIPKLSMRGNVVGILPEWKGVKNIPFAYDSSSKLVLTVLTHQMLLEKLEQYGYINRTLSGKYCCYDTRFDGPIEEICKTLH